jgi:hypothetical protein
MSQAISGRLSTAQTQIRSYGICGEQCGTGAGFIQALLFPLPVPIAPKAPYSSIIRDWYNTIISGRLTKRIQSHPTSRS